MLKSLALLTQNSGRGGPWSRGGSLGTVGMTHDACEPSCAGGEMIALGRQPRHCCGRGRAWSQGQGRKRLEAPWQSLGSFFSFFLDLSVTFLVMSLVLSPQGRVRRVRWHCIPETWDPWASSQTAGLLASLRGPEPGRAPEVTLSLPPEPFSLLLGRTSRGSALL